MYRAATAEYSPGGTRGLTTGFNYLGVFGVGSLGGTSGGVILTDSSGPVFFLTLAGFATIAAAVGLILDRR